jgi:hypothetical protein
LKKKSVAKRLMTLFYVRGREAGKNTVKRMVLILKMILHESKRMCQTFFVRCAVMASWQ